MEKIYIVYEEGNDFGYLLEDISDHLYWVGGQELIDKLYEMLETCKTREEELNVIRQFVTLVDRGKYSEEIAKMNAERYVKRKELLLRVISENPGIRFDELPTFACIEYGDHVKPTAELIKENLVKVSSAKLPYSGGLPEKTLYENIEKYKDVEEYECYLNRFK